MKFLKELLKKKKFLIIIVLIVILALVGYSVFIRNGKPVGAKGRTITTIFLIESGFFGLFGGLGGIILGLGLAKAVEFFLQVHPIFYLEASVSPQLIIFGLTFSFLVGCIAGYLPSRSASKLKPVDALRYE